MMLGSYGLAHDAWGEFNVIKFPFEKRMDAISRQVWKHSSISLQETPLSYMGVIYLEQ